MLSDGGELGGDEENEPMDEGRCLCSDERRSGKCVRDVDRT